MSWIKADKSINPLNYQSKSQNKIVRNIKKNLGFVVHPPEV